MMLSIPEIGLADVQAVFSGPEADLWQLLMGQQIHVGGLRSSMELAQLAGLADACDSGLPEATPHFVWSEDAWCYVVDKGRLVDEALRLLRTGGIVAFTDWVAGARPMSQVEGERMLRFMKFSTIQSIAGYCALFEDRGCQIRAAEYTGRFADCLDLYSRMVDQQRDFDQEVFAAVVAEMEVLQQLAHAGKLVQGRFVAVRSL